MSAIWGAINLLGNELNDEYFDTMYLPYKDCKVDRFEFLKESTFFLACGLQYFTPEAVFEQLPYSCEQRFYFTADAVLDNRQELLKKLKIEETSANPITDGAILFQYYKTFGKKCLNDILGTYVFVYYDKVSGQVEIISDSVGSRMLYYKIHNNTLFFSSLLKPLETIGVKSELNGTWLSHFLAAKNLGIATDGTSTTFEDIHCIPMASIVTLKQSGKLTKEKYWKPLVHNKELKLKNDLEYKEKFNEIFDQSVQRLLRSNGKTGVLLSGGLDSTAVACFAAPHLKKQGETLYSYTSVPEADYPVNLNSEETENETEFVLKTKEFLGNMECTFVDTAGLNAWDSRKNYMEYYEIPYKSIQNVIWMTEISKRAAEDGNRILLTGSTGNGAFSYGNLNMLLVSSFQRLKFKKFMDEVNILRKVGNSRKHVIFNVILFSIQSLWKVKINSKSDMLKTYITDNAIRKYKLTKTLTKRKKMKNTMNIFDARVGMASEVALRQVAEFETKQSLRTGVLMRDPTKDKRLLEFCMSIPENQFAWGLVERRLVNDYLKEKLPSFINMRHKRGLQSADVYYRLEKDWNRIYNELYDTFVKAENNFFIDTKKALANLEKLKEGFKEADGFDIIELIYNAMILDYIQIYK